MRVGGRTGQSRRRRRKGTPGVRFEKEKRRGEKVEPLGRSKERVVGQDAGQSPEGSLLFRPPGSTAHRRQNATRVRALLSRSGFIFPKMWLASIDYAFFDSKEPIPSLWQLKMGERLDGVSLGARSLLFFWDPADPNVDWIEQRRVTH